jgi:hypothetical protein
MRTFFNSFIFMTLSFPLLISCGVKSAPMPRSSEVFIRKTEVESEQKKKTNKIDKTTIIPKKDVR